MTTTNLKKTLVVILCMHRCGSSLTSWLLQRLGMSLGPFELVEGCESNKYGHFEAKPFLTLNRELQLQEFGFADEWPFDAETFRRYCEADGRWTSENAITDQRIAHGRELVHQLMASGVVCGFKDPRTVLVWPFWQRVFAGMPELRVIPLFLVRSPHEIAMSLFRRSWGVERYSQALEVIAIHFRRMKDICDQWAGPKAVVQFDPQVYREQMCRAATICGLPWSDSILAEVYDASCRHYESAAVEHPAQAAFEALAGLPHKAPDVVDLRRLLADATSRETFWQRECDIRQQERDAVRQELEAAKQRLVSAELERNEAIVRLDLIQRSRMWRFRNMMVKTFLSSQGHEDPILADDLSERRRVA